MFITASDAIARILRADGIPAAQIVDRPRRNRRRSASRTSSRPACTRRSGCRPTPPSSATSARSWPHKGQRHLIDAAAIVLRDVPDARVVILGEGELRGSLEHQVKALHLEKHVLLPGFRDDVLALLKGFDVFVMCSETEGLGTSILDAMACGKPVVGTNTGGIPEVVEDGVTGLAGRAARPEVTRACHHDAAAGRGTENPDGGRRPGARAASSSQSIGWWREPSRSTSRCSRRAGSTCPPVEVPAPHQRPVH